MPTDSKDIIEINSIKLNINGLIIEVKIDRARELWRKLDEIFGPKPAQWVYPTWGGYGAGTPAPSQPVWVSPNMDDPRFPQITCNAYTGNTLELR